MTKYIEANRFQRKLLNWAGDCDPEDPEQVHDAEIIQDCAYSIDDEPAVEMNPVIHAHWIGPRLLGDYKCSNCHFHYHLESIVLSNHGREYSNYCPYCGARMDKKTEEENAA